jgi:hypothetical protein
MDGVCRFWREVCLELPNNGSGRHVLAEYSQLELWCEMALSSFYTVLRYRLDHSLMNLSSVRPPTDGTLSGSSTSAIDVVASSPSSSSSRNDGVHPAPPRRRFRVMARGRAVSREDRDSSPPSSPDPNDVQAPSA